MFHSLIPLKKVQILKGNVKCKTYYIKRVGNRPLFNVQKNIFSCWPFFVHVLTILAWTKYRLVTKLVLSITHFHSLFFLTFPFKFYLYKKFKLYSKDYFLFIYTFMCMLTFLRIIILSFRSPKPAYKRGFGNGVESVRTVLKFDYMVEFLFTGLTVNLFKYLGFGDFFWKLNGSLGVCLYHIFPGHRVVAVNLNR